MPSESLISEIEDILGKVINLGGQKEQTSMAPNLTVIDSAPTGLDGFVIVSDNRDGDNILARKVGSIVYSDGDKINTLFVEGTEAVAFQQGSESPSTGNIWEIVPSTSTDIFYDRGDVGIGKSVAPDASLEILSQIQAQLRLTHTEDTKFVDFTLDTNHDLTITPSSVGQIILQPTSNSTDFFQVRNAASAVVINADTTNIGLGVATSDLSFVLQGATVRGNLFVERGVAGGRRTAVFSAVGAAQADNTFLKARAGPGAAANNDIVGNFFYSGHDGTDYNRSARIYIDIDGAVAANTVPMAINFQTSTTNSGGLADRLKIEPAGNIKVGTGAASAQLHIEQAASGGAEPVLQVTQADISEEIIWYEGESSAGSADMSLVDASDFTTPGALLGWTKNKIEDNRVGGLGIIDVWVPFYAIPTA